MLNCIYFYYANVLQYMLGNHGNLIKVLIGGKLLKAVKLSVMCFYKTSNQNLKKKKKVVAQSE